MGFYVFKMKFQKTAGHLDIWTSTNKYGGLQRPALKPKWTCWTLSIESSGYGDNDDQILL